MAVLLKSKQRIQIPEPIPVHLARKIANLSPTDRRAFILRQSVAKALTIKYTWAAWARDKQLWQIEAPEEWETWLHLAGRGYGKTRTGSEQTIEWALDDPEGHIALVGRTVADVRDVMIGGKSGILKCSPPWFRPEYIPSKRHLTWPNGCTATTYSADQPNQLRGPQHTKAWGDERASWQYDDAYDQLQFGLRLGRNPQLILTTTPRATEAIKELIKEPGTHTTYGTTYENTANLTRKFFTTIERKYGGTRLGLQELLGRILDDNPGALWKRSNIDKLRVRYGEVPELKRVVVAVDPAVKSPDAVKAARGELDESVAETGIVVCGLGVNNEGYVIADYSMQGTPLEWAQQVAMAYEIHQADAVIGEVNNGGDLVESNIRTVNKNISYIAVRATRGKQVRAEPVSSLYQQGRVHHVGTLPDLEDQCCNWIPGDKSPDRLDALVWGFTRLMVGQELVGGMMLDTDVREQEEVEEDEQEEQSAYALFR
jgi:phage terminase large subunit-like protein